MTLSNRLHMLHFLLHKGPCWLKRGPVVSQCSSSPSSLLHSLRCWVPHGRASLAPACVCAALALPPISTTCTLLQHHRELYPYSPSRQLGKNSTPRHSHSPCCPILEMGAHCLWHLFNATWWPIHCFPVFHWGPHQEDMATCYHMLCGGHWLPSIHWASGSPFAGYPADYASCLAIHTVCWTQGLEDERKLPTSWEVGRNSRTVGTACVFSPRWCGSQCSRYAIFSRGLPSRHSHNVATT